ncbi:hypothetical protein C6558_32130 [Ensifer sp. NM-2]|uniref:hypothetical protein n=1 Tax=Ensifer sp. NM-2 TaxID=2109730 RepID=UPI000D120B8F|nr:hypothetical protein [Ensifer sp. NM-2]PSS60627.1 hypothetical protein C6558_32130 [Ensifer sp. NM-2]
MAPQAIVHIVRGGGARSVARICSQWKYLTRFGKETPHGKVKFRLCQRYGNAVVPYEALADWAQRWAGMHGNYVDGECVSDGEEAMTSHIVVSFPRFRDMAPPGYDIENDPDNRREAYKDAADRAGMTWAAEVLEPELTRALPKDAARQYLDYVYGAFFHVDQEHPHIHVTLNRRSLTRDVATGEHPLSWITPRVLDNWRVALVNAAHQEGIDLEATSRASRGLSGRSTTIAQTYMRARERDMRNDLAPADPEAQVPEWETEVFGPLTRDETYARAREDVIVREHGSLSEIPDYFFPDDPDDSGSGSDGFFDESAPDSRMREREIARMRERIRAGKQAATSGGGSGASRALEGRQSGDRGSMTTQTAWDVQTRQATAIAQQIQAAVPGQGGPGPATMEARARLQEQLMTGSQSSTSGGGSGSGGLSEPDRQLPPETARPAGPAAPQPQPDGGSVGAGTVATGITSETHRGDSADTQVGDTQNPEQPSIDAQTAKEAGAMRRQQRKREAEAFDDEGNGRKRRRGRGNKIDEERSNAAEAARSAGRAARRAAEVDPAIVAARSIIETRAQRSRRENAEREEARRAARARRRGDDIIGRVVKTRGEKAREALANQQSAAAGAARPPEQQQLALAFPAQPLAGASQIDAGRWQGPETRLQVRQRAALDAANQAPAPTNKSTNPGGGGDTRGAENGATKRTNPRKRDHDSTR